jgi:hypothetical protein
MAQVKPPGAVACPSCGALESVKPKVEFRSSFSLPVFLLGGIFAVIFRNAGRGKKMRCHNCGTIFTVRSAMGKVSRVIYWVLVAPSVALIIGYLMYLAWSLFKSGP